MTPDDLFRLINIGLILASIWYMWPLHPWWASRPREERLLLICMPLMLLMVIFSSGESIMQNIGFGSRILLWTPVLILFLVSSIRLSRKIKKHTEDEKGEKNRADKPRSRKP